MAQKTFMQEIKRTLGDRKWKSLSTGERKIVQELSTIQSKISRQIDKPQQVSSHTSK